LPLEGCTVSPTSTRIASAIVSGLSSTASSFASNPSSEPPARTFAAPAITTANASVRYAYVRFKHESATFLAPFRIAVDDLVVVEGDRGENVGIVQEITQLKPSFAVSSKILRKASDKDLAALRVQREKEQAALNMVQSLAASLNLHCTVEDVEYQFDMNKLTIFVRRSAKNAFVDFRKLQRGLFREFRCRIWCSYMDEVEAVEQGPRSR